MNQDHKADAKSVKANIIQDNMVVRVNIRYLLNGIIFFATIAGGVYSVKSQIDSNTERIKQIDERVSKLEQKHDEEIKKIQESWYQSINPLKKRRNK